MKIRFISRGGLADGQVCEDEELTIYGFGGLGEVSYDKELKGESDYFERAARLSKQTKGVVVCGCVTDTRGIKRKSALVAENGKLCGVSDMTHTIDGALTSGAGLRIYDTKIGKMGVAVAEDILFPEVMSALAACGSDFIVCPFGVLQGTMPQVLLRAYAYLHGVPIFLCGVGYSVAVGADGGVVMATPQSPTAFVFENRKEFHLVETRRRGVFQT
jgi:predicted amidohydrolase